MDEMVAIGITILSIVIILILIWLGWIVYRYYIQKRAGAPNRIELYFDENFKNIVDEWDLQSRSKVKTWKADIMKRLTTVGSDIDRLKNVARTTNDRLERLNKEMTRLEKM